MNIVQFASRQAPCEECQKAREEHQGDLIYTFSFYELDLSVSFHVQRARAFMRRYLAAYKALLIGYGDARADEFLQQRVQLLELSQLRQWIDQFSAVNFNHLPHIPREKLEEPGILLDFGPHSIPEHVRPGLLSAVPDLPERHTILMDGNHRGAIAAAAGEDYPVYVLPPEEQQAVFCHFSLGLPFGIAST